jgi:hypothetical protein
VVPATVPVSTIGVMADPEQIVWLTGAAVAFGSGFTNTVAIVVGPTQPLAVGVIVKVTNTGNKVVLVSMPLMSPDPLAAMPVAATVLSLVQVYVVPATALVNTIVVIAVPEQTVWLAGVATAFGVG